MFGPFLFPAAGGNAEWPFSGVIVDHMTPVYFRQGVLEKYQGSATYAVDDGGVRCGHFWSTGTSTRRIGNEFVAVPIGDFGIGVPFHEWPHWRQFAVPPPSRETVEVAHSEPAIVTLVNDLTEKLVDLNRAFYIACFDHGIDGAGLWDGSLDTPAGRNLKRYYREDAHDDEFLERATFVVSLTIDQLRAKPLQAFLRNFEPTLHLSFDARIEKRTPLRSVRLLERVALVVQISAAMHPERATMARLVRAAEGHADAELDQELVHDLQSIRDDVRKRLASLAFLNDLRNKAGIAHRAASPETIGEIVRKFGLAKKGWKRRDYLVLLKTIGTSVAAASSLLSER